MAGVDRGFNLVLSGLTIFVFIALIILRPLGLR
jgi:hypothetical protein